MGEGVGMNAPAKVSEPLRLQKLAYLNPPPLQEEEFIPPKSLIYTLSLFEEGVPAGGGRCHPPILQ